MLIVPINLLGRLNSSETSGTFTDAKAIDSITGSG